MIATTVRLPFSNCKALSRIFVSIEHPPNSETRNAKHETRILAALLFLPFVSRFMFHVSRFL
jgi:hypothetical protein